MINMRTGLKHFSLQAANNNLRILLELKIDYNDSNIDFCLKEPEGT